MADSNSIEYFRKREQQARECAKAATDRGVELIHLDMAARYAEMAGEPTNILKIV